MLIHNTLNSSKGKLFKNDIFQWKTCLGLLKFSLNIYHMFTLLNG